MKWRWVIFGAASIALLAVVAPSLTLLTAPTLTLPRSTRGGESTGGGNQIQVTGYTMGGTWSVKVRALPEGVTQERLQAVVGGVLDRLDGMCSNYKAGSDLSRFNTSASTDWVNVPREMVEIVTAARQVSEASGGAFDVTVAPVVNLWGFGGEKTTGVRIGQVPSDREVEAARQRVGFERLEMRHEPPAIRKPRSEMAIDFGGIAKGYAADAVARKLDRLGVKGYLIAVGGELRAHGAWTVGIDVPTPDSRRILKSFTLKDVGLSTSGNYRNFVDVGGHRYSHEINPRTGRPVETKLVSVSVMHESSTLADAWATALFVLGPEEGFALAERLGLAALLITREADHFEQRETREWSSRR